MVALAVSETGQQYKVLVWTKCHCAVSYLPNDIAEYGNLSQAELDLREGEGANGGEDEEDLHELYLAPTTSRSRWESLLVSK